ncbi:MAG: serine hydrolase domain-containing protein [Bacteroidota bacterium]
MLPDGKIEDYAVGYADVEAKKANSPDYKLLSGSIGKTYAAAIIFQLLDEGKIKLEDKILDYFPDLPWLKRLPNIQELTIELLLQHRTGLPRWVLKEEVWKKLSENPDKVWTYEDRFSYVFDEEPVHKAGEGWAYSDTNYLLLGMLIEKVLEGEYYEILENRILKPFQLNKTLASNQRKITNLSSGYSELPPQFYIPKKVSENGVYHFNPQVEWTGGGLASTTHDLARWAKLYFEAQVFSPETLEKVIQINPNGSMIGGRDSYGMASFIYHSKYGDAYGHSGFMPGFVSQMMYFPQYKIALALQFNADFAANDLNLLAYIEEIFPLIKK